MDNDEIFDNEYNEWENVEPTLNAKIINDKIYIGQILSFFPEKGFGFILTQEHGNVFFHKSHVKYQDVKLNDLVSFNITPSKKLSGEVQAIRVERAYYSMDKYIVINKYHKRLQRGIEDVFSKILAESILMGKETINEQVNFSEPIGETYCVFIDEGDDVVYAQRKTGQKGISKLVKNKKPQPTKSFTFFLKKEEDCFSITTAYFGEMGKPWPWDSHGNIESVRYWENRALVYIAEDVDENTMVKECPWYDGIL